MKKTESTPIDVIAWRNAAIADGWRHFPTYHNESEDRAVTLKSDGFTCMITSRNAQKQTIRAWCPRGLALEVPAIYSMAELYANLRLCSECSQVKEEIVCVAFANRVCKECEPSARRKYEFPRWRD